MARRHLLPQVSAATAAVLLAVIALDAAVAQTDSGVLDRPESRADAAAGQSQQPPRFRPPSTAAAEKAVAKVREIFADDFAAASTGDAKSSLARTLVTEATKTAAPLDQWALLTEAIALAGDAGDAAGVFTAIDALDRSFAIDGLAMRLDGLAKAARRATAESAQAVADAAIRMVDELLARKDFSSAIKSLSIASTMAGRAKNPQLLAQTKQLAVQVRDQEKLAKKGDQLVAKYRANTADPVACQELGGHLCFDEGNWDRGLPLLARGADAELAAIARADLDGAGGSSPAALADKWAAWADKQRPSGPKAAAQERACEFYARALESLEGLERTRVQKRMAALGAGAGGALAKAKGGPKSIPGIVLWLDVGDPSSVVLAGKGQAVPRVARWRDLSGLGNDVVQPDEARQPVFRHGAVEFDGKSTLVGASPIRLAALTLLVVFKTSPDAARADAAIVSTATGSTNGWVLDNHGGNINFRVYGENPSRHELNAGPNTSASAQVALATVNNGGVVSTQLAGGRIATGQQGKRNADSSLPLHIGQGTASWSFPNFKGQFFRVVLFSRSLEPAELSLLLDWNARRPVE